jgi:voltage-gated potassium channel
MGPSRKQKKHKKDSLKQRLSRANESFKSLMADLSRVGLPKILAFFFGFLAAFALLVFVIERGAGNEMFARIEDAAWWSLVTIATVGYGDKYPITDFGRIAAGVLMMSGLAITAMLSATLASIFVERRIREGQGLQGIRMKGHTILCGWNSNGFRLVEDLAAASGGARRAIALVNGIDAEGFEGIKARFPSMELRFVRGDFTSETLLKRAAVEDAAAAIIVPDESMGEQSGSADERTILGALAIKSLNPDIKLSCEIIKPESETHLRRAKVDNILVRGEYAGFILSSSTESTGLPAIVRELLSHSSKGRLRQEKVPQPFIGKSWLEYASQLLRSGGGIPIAVVSQEKDVSLDALISDDSSAIDAFIKRKFKEADIDLAAEAIQDQRVSVNPGPDYVLRDDDVAFVIG